MSEKLKNVEMGESNQGTATEWGELKNEPFVTEEDTKIAGEQAGMRYQSAKEMFNDGLFNPKSDFGFGIDEYRDKLIANIVLPVMVEGAVDAFGAEECMKVCDERLGSMTISSVDENEQLFDRVDDILLEEAEDASEDEKFAEVKRVEIMRKALDGLLVDAQIFEDGSIQSLESVAKHKIAKETRNYLKRLSAEKVTDEYREKYSERVTALAELQDFLRFQRKLMRDENKAKDEEAPVSYNIERGFTYPAATITVGQEIPDSWFGSRVSGERDKNGFGVSFEATPLVESYLGDILNTEFAKIPEDERKQYNYVAISNAIKEEVRRTKKIPNIAAIIEVNKRA